MNITLTLDEAKELFSLYDERIKRLEDLVLNNKSVEVKPKPVAKKVMPKENEIKSVKIGDDFVSMVELAKEINMSRQLLSYYIKKGNVDTKLCNRKLYVHKAQALRIIKNRVKEKKEASPYLKFDKRPYMGGS